MQKAHSDSDAFFLEMTKIALKGRDVFSKKEIVRTARVVKLVNQGAAEKIDELTNRIEKEKLRLVGVLAEMIWTNQITIVRAAEVAGMPLEEFRTFARNTKIHKEHAETKCSYTIVK